MGNSTIPTGCVAILGAGTQGRRLAYMWSSQGNEVRLIDAQEKQLQDSVTFVKELQYPPESPDTTARTVTTYGVDDLEKALQGAWLVIECVPERLELKKQVVAQLDSLASETTIIASNSSSYTIGEIIDGLTLTGEQRVLSMHSYWPPETPAIEIMGHQTTTHAHITTLMTQSRLHGFSPFRVQKDSMGYIYNRIWAAIKRESLLAASEGVATPQEIDLIFKDVLKTPKGPFEQMDVVGLDVVLDIERHYAEQRGNVPEEPQVYLQGLIEGGRLGVKSGKGFYEYN